VKYFKSTTIESIIVLVYCAITWLPTVPIALWVDPRIHVQQSTSNTVISIIFTALFLMLGVAQANKAKILTPPNP